MLDRIFLVSVALVSTGALLFEGNGGFVKEFSELEYADSIEGPLKAREHWVVMHYSSFCGHCIRFAPQFVEVAKSYNSLSPDGWIIRFAAIDLSVPATQGILIRQGILLLPTFHIWQGLEGPDGSLTRSRSAVMQGGDVNTLTQRINSVFPSHASVRFVNQETPAHQPVAPKSTLASPVASVLFDATLALSHILNMEVFKGEQEYIQVDDVDKLLGLLDLCADTIDLDDVRRECRFLANQIRTTPRIIKSLYRNEFRELLNATENFKGYEQLPPFKSCRSSTCATWRLLHVLSLGPLSAESTITPDRGMVTIRDLVDRFFSCAECRTHFLEHYDMCDYDRCRVSLAQLSWRDVSLWLWRLHNGVSARVHPARSAWPKQSECSSCVNDSQLFDEDQVYIHLQRTHTSSQPTQDAQTESRSSSIVLSSSIQSLMFTIIVSTFL